MHPDLEHLIQLQDVDSAAETARRRIADMPAAVAALDARIAARMNAVAIVKERIAASQTSRREIEKELAAVQARLSKYKGQLMEVKTNKEYQAMQKEMSVAEQDVRGHEDRLLERMEDAETLAAELKNEENALKAEQAEVGGLRQQLDVERAAAEAELQRTIGQRVTLTGQLSRETMMLYERVAHGRKGLAVAEARDGLCTVCHVRLRPQVFNEVRRNDSVIQCDSCTRILFFAAPRTA
ncbi:MAG: C4-type zinc ribbon domain-containing protein [Acidobacteria bacterium]|nr:C4-type zinc ribbon domain-containing protein [Acidobacteriota bacterium]MCA1650049.1 C4-type zinc ribbon domain-containing protein [Acidobacteriota bacterium]